MALRCWLVWVVVVATSVAASAAPGDLDDSFNGGGTIVTAVSTAYDAVTDVVAMADGRIVTAGYAYVADELGNFDPIFALSRYDREGALDPTFGNGGLVLSFVGDAGGASSMVLQPDGKIVAAGSTEYDGIDEFAVVRYNPDGSLDSTFDDDGIASVRFGSAYDSATGLILQPDGKLVASGITNLDSRRAFALARLNGDGSPDTSFGDAGKVVTDLAGMDDWATALTLQADGKIVVAGYTRTSPSDTRAALARYHPDGTLDLSFGTDGKVVTVVGVGYIDRLAAVATQSDGKIVAVGRSHNLSDFDIALLRYNSDGSLDPLFGNGGIVLTDTGVSDGATDVLVLPDDRLCVAGGTENDGGAFATVCYSSDGVIDPSFGNQGIATTNFGINGEGANAIAVQPDGKLVVAGVSDNDSAMARYEGDRPCLAPFAACSGSGRAFVLMKRGNASRDRVVLKWRNGQPITQLALSDPTDDTNYAVCVFAGSEQSNVFAAVIPGGDRWKALGDRGYRYSDRNATADGILRALLKGSEDDRSKALVKGKGSNLPAAPAEALALPVTFQLRNESTGACIEATFDTSDVLRNDAQQLKAKLR